MPAKKAGKKKETTSQKVMTFGDEEEAHDDFRGNEWRVKVDETEPGTTFQGIFSHSFVNEGGEYGDSTGYVFLDLNGERTTVWGSTVFDRIMEDEENNFKTGDFLTIEYQGYRGRNKVKIFRVTRSKKGAKKFAALVKEAKKMAKEAAEVPI